MSSGSQSLRPLAGTGTISVRKTLLDVNNSSGGNNSEDDESPLNVVFH